MKKTVLAFILITFALAGWTQEADSTATEKEQPVIENNEEESVEEKVVDEEEKEEINEEPQVKEEAVVEENTENEEAAPKIIYYQTTEKERKRGRQDIKTLSGSMSHSGGFGAISFRTTKFRNESMVLAGLRGGWIINRTLGIGFEGHGIIPTAIYKDIIPTVNGSVREVKAQGGYGGLFLELIFFSNQVVHVTFPVSGGAGWLGYTRNGDDNLSSGNSSGSVVDGDVFWYVEPAVDLEFNISRNFRLAAGISKRFVQDLQLINTEPKDFEKLNYFLTLKVGGF